MTFAQVFGHFRHCLEGPEEHGINQGVGSVKFNVICIMLLAVQHKVPVGIPVGKGNPWPALPCPIILSGSHRLR